MLNEPPVAAPAADKKGISKARYFAAFALVVLVALYDGRLGLFGLGLVLAFVALVWLAKTFPKLGIVLGLGFLTVPLWMWHWDLLFNPALSILLIFTWLGAVASVTVGASMLWAALDRREYTDEEKQAAADKALQSLKDDVLRH
jgi:hypothetical protein